MKIPFQLLRISALLITALVASAKPVDNDIVLKLLAADMPEDVILQVITAGEPNFDTSVDGLTALREAGATNVVLAAILTGNAGPAEATPTATAAKRGESLLKEDDVLLIDDGKESQMAYTNAETRGGARALGFGGAAIYAVLPGSSSDVTTTGSPEFIVSIPENAKPQSHFQLANFAIRRNGNREVMVGGGVMSVSIGIHPDRVIATAFERLDDQSRASEGQALYRMKPNAPLAAGQYAIVAKLSGAGNLMGGNVTGQWYDFQVR